jgi:hypothetical protein
LINGRVLSSFFPFFKLLARLLVFLAAIVVSPLFQIAPSGLAENLYASRQAMSTPTPAQLVPLRMWEYSFDNDLRR